MVLSENKVLSNLIIVYGHLTDIFDGHFNVFYIIKKETKYPNEIIQYHTNEKEWNGGSSYNSITNAKTSAATYTFNLIPFIKKDTLEIQISFNVKIKRVFFEIEYCIQSES